ncbi:hypothetical protein [Anabaena azotica]|uniref:Uncharacterized protein n=1 Tax=Anabaena azotica FACHB-119 TaxID=947527 RepID=A0ABR8CZZ9_9NOST|nr:hypothetical protein [Anabaena azotica]MBD2500432.1 hypothetical protein [Anabaena azotica FACHB-119]
MNNKIIEYVVKLILSLSEEEYCLLEGKLFFNSSYPSTAEIIELANRSKTFDFLDDEPDLYTLEDGEPI